MPVPPPAEVADCLAEEPWDAQHHVEGKEHGDASGRGEEPRGKTQGVNREEQPARSQRNARQRRELAPVPLGNAEERQEERVQQQRHTNGTPSGQGRHAVRRRESPNQLVEEEGHLVQDKQHRTACLHVAEPGKRALAEEHNRPTEGCQSHLGNEDGTRCKHSLHQSSLRQVIATRGSRQRRPGQRQAARGRNAHRGMAPAEHEETQREAGHPHGGCNLHGPGCN
mmetsp:Transcript_82753/g.246889  ORF Transcript_82753/g.246889 Transcript_82753/m.246889 type:complete len:225 (+) Transcript_82753:647-1321(+)